MPKLWMPISAAALMFSSLACSAVISLDFNTAATGANLGSSPLVTPAGTVSLSAIGTGTASIAPNGHPSNGIEHVQVNETDRALLSFSFNVSSITFDFAGEGGGNFLAEALDIGGGVLASFSFTNTSCTGSCFDASNVVLTGVGIRAFRFADTPAGANISFVDNVRLETSTVTEPTSVVLTGLALLGLALSCRVRPR